MRPMPMKTRAALQMYDKLYRATGTPVHGSRRTILLARLDAYVRAMNPIERGFYYAGTTGQVLDEVRTA